MATPDIRAKIAKPTDEAVTSTEIEVVKCLNELENNPQCEIKGDLKLIKIAGAIELNVNGDENRKVNHLLWGENFI